MEPCAVEGAAEVAIVRMCRYEVKNKTRFLDKRMSPCIFSLDYEVIECWRGFAREERVEKKWGRVDICCRISVNLVSGCEGILW